MEQAGKVHQGYAAGRQGQGTQSLPCTEWMRVNTQEAGARKDEHLPPTTHQYWTIHRNIPFRWVQRWDCKKAVDSLKKQKQKTLEQGGSSLSKGILTFPGQFFDHQLPSKWKKNNYLYIFFHLCWSERSHDQRSKLVCWGGTTGRSTTYGMAPLIRSTVLLQWALTFQLKHVLPSSSTPQLHFRAKIQH